MQNQKPKEETKARGRKRSTQHPGFAAMVLKGDDKKALRGTGRGAPIEKATIWKLLFANLYRLKKFEVERRLGAKR